MPTSRPGWFAEEPRSTTGMPEILLSAIRRSASAKVSSGWIVTGLTTIPASNFLTLRTSACCCSIGMLRWMTPRPPACAIAIASAPSVTVSIAAEISGMPSSISRVMRVRVSVSAGSTLEAETDTRTRITREIELGIPLISAAMDTVTEGALAIAMAQAGGLGVIHRNMPIEQQQAEVRKVKKFEAGMVVNPVTIHPDETLADALRLMADNKISGIPVVERGPYPNQPGRLCGILTNRDVRFADNPNQPVAELMTKDDLVTVHETTSRDEAKRLLHQHRIEKLLVVDREYRCTGLITVKDIEKAQLHPFACKDEHGRLRVAAAAGTGRAELERAEALFAAGVDIMVVDTRS